MCHSFAYLSIQRPFRCFSVLAFFFAGFVSGCGGPTPITTPPTLTLEIWRDPALAAIAANISTPYTTATPAIPVTFVASEFTKPLPHQHNVNNRDEAGFEPGMCGWHVSNALNKIMEYKMDLLFDTETESTRNVMKALVCSHEIAHYWWTGHVAGLGNVMNATLSVNLALYQAGALPAFSVSQANKIVKTIL